MYNRDDLIIQLRGEEAEQYILIRNRAAKIAEMAKRVVVKLDKVARAADQLTSQTKEK